MDIINNQITGRPIEEIIADINKIKHDLVHSNASEKIDDMSIQYRSIKDLKDILFALEQELDEAINGGKSQKWVRGIRRGFQLQK